MNEESIFTSDEIFLDQWKNNRDALVKELAKKYGIAPEIVDLASARDARTWEQAQLRNIMARKESLRIRINNRFVVMMKNKEALNRIIDDFGVEKRNYFDVGCGLGSTLLAAKELGFKYAAGVEMDRAFISFSREVMSKFYDHTTSYYECSFFDVAPDRYFSFLTFFDVLEHINDVRGAITKASNMLDDRGVIYWYQGNSRSLEMVLNEPHYRLPGLSILPKEIAVDVLTRSGKIPDPKSYVVAWWPRLSDIDGVDSVRIFVHNGNENIRNGVQIPSTKSVVEKARSQVPNIADRLKDYLTDSQLTEVRSLMAKYLSDLLSAADNERRFKFEYASHSWNMLHWKDETMITPQMKELIVDINSLH